MTIKTFSFILVIALAGSSCGSDAPEQTSAPTEAETTATAPGIGTAQSTNPQEVAPMPAPEAAAPASTAAAPAPAGGSSSGKVNPPHGQPGHVCGTPVGAPLNGAAAATPASKPSVAPVTTNPQPAGANTATVAPGTNPPHGQPGHVCGTPVGAPLPAKQ